MYVHMQMSQIWDMAAMCEDVIERDNDHRLMRYCGKSSRLIVKQLNNLA